MMMNSKWKLLVPIVAMTFLAAGAGNAQRSAQTMQDLPTAPSAVKSAEARVQADEAQGKPAGNGFALKFMSQPLTNGLAMEQPTSGPLRLSLDDAISLGLQRNIRLLYDRQNQKSVRGLTLSVVNVLIPTLSLAATSNAQELNLAAMGFGSSEVGKLTASGLIPAGYTIPTIVKVDVTQASVKMSQTLFNMADFELYRGTKNETNIVDLQMLTDRGDVVLTVGRLYLNVLADEANVNNDVAQVKSAKTLFDQASDKQAAGVGVHLDTLRSEVQYQQRVQDLVSAQNTLAKDKIQLARVLGIPVGQELELTDKTPYQDLASMDLATAKTTAYAHRKDFLSLQEEDKLDHHISKAVKYQRLPVLVFNGFYGVIGQTTGSYHGNFNAEGSLTFPIFNEAAQRGQQEVVAAQLRALQQRESDLRVTIDAQIRAAILDVTTAEELVKVAESNVDLAKQELADEQDRFSAGVDDSLPVVDAQSSVTSAQAQLVQSLYQYNVAKLMLARNTGVVETRYRSYLGM